MAKPYQFEQSTRERRMRYFSESFKRTKVDEIERNLTTIAEVSREYQVSDTSIYRWLNKYSQMKKKGVRQIVETQSDTKKLLAMEEKIRELERIIGQKQIQIDFKDKMIEIAEETYGVDIKKKFGSSPSSGSGITGKDTPGN